MQWLPNELQRQFCDLYVLRAYFPFDSVTLRSSGLAAIYLTFPGPQIARPVLAFVCSPSFRTCTPFTKTCFMPTEYWCGFANVARSAIVFGSKTTTSANIPTLRNPRRSNPRFVAGRPVKRRIASASVITFSSRTYLPNRRAKLPYARGCVEDLRKMPSGAIDAPSEPNDTHGRPICFLMFSSDI